MEGRRLIREHIKNGRLDEAAALLETTELADVDRHPLELWLARSRQDFPAIRRLLDRQIAAGDTSPELLISAGWACMRLEDHAAAAARAAEVLRHNPDNMQAIKIAAHAAVGLADEPGAEHYLRETIRLDPTDIRAGVELMRLLNGIGRVRESAEHFERLRAMAPDNPHVRVVGFRYFAHSTRELRDHTSPLQADAPRATQVIAKHLQEELLTLRNILARSPPDDALRRPVVDYEIGQEVMVGTCPGAPLTVVSFTGFTDQMMGLPVTNFDRYLAALGVNAIYVNDFRRLFFAGGVPSLGPDYAGTLAGLRDLVGSLGAPRLATIGASAGGLAAVRYGVELGADCVLSFSGRSVPGDIFDSGERDPWNNLIEGRLMRSGLADLAYLRKFLLANPSDTRIELIYGAEMGVDAHHAAMISDLPGVHTRPIPGLKVHAAIDHMAETTDFREELRQLLRLPAA